MFGTENPRHPRIGPRKILTQPPSKSAGTETGMEFNEQKVSLSGVYLDS